jgi:hypothetical protein
MRLRHAFVLLCAPLCAFAAHPLLLQPGEWTDAPAILRRAATALKEPIVHASSGDPAPLRKFAGTVETLAVAASKSGNLEFARRAGDWIRAWLVDPATRMNPALGFADVIEGRELLRVVDAVRILEGSGALTEQDQLAVRTWLGDHYNWLATSERGKAAAEARDHHGTWYVVQLIALATHLGSESDVERLCEHGRRLIAGQIAAGGAQPLEIARADGLSNSIFNLEGHMFIALLASQAHVDLWNHVPESGAGLRAAVEYLRPFNVDPAKWPHGQVRAVAPGALDRVLAIAKRLDDSMARE